MYTDIADQADAVAEQLLNAAMAKRVRPRPVLAIYRNGDYGKPSLPKTSYCCGEYREDAEKIARFKVFNRH